MRVLAHVHTFNDADIIEGTIASVLQQTRPVDGLLLVDNASTDGTLDQPSLKHATVMRHSENRGTSGAVVTGMRYALERGYDWIWLFDADSNPEPDALEKLLELYASWPHDVQEKVGYIACLPFDAKDHFPYHASVFAPRGFMKVTPKPDEYYYSCHITLWSGILFRLAAVRRIGLPNPDYVLDWGECEYAYRVMKAGYQGYMHQQALLHHNTRGKTSMPAPEGERGPAEFAFHRFPPIRCYYLCRNAVYFALYEEADGHFRLVCLGMLVLTMKLFVRPWHHGKQISACFRGMWHGLTGNIAARY